jgi:hypothetical protein
MSGAMTIKGGGFNAALWVPKELMARWRQEEPEEAERVMLEANRRLSTEGVSTVPNREDLLTVYRLVLNDGDEVALLHLAATGLIDSVKTFSKAVLWVKRRRDAKDLLERPEVSTARQRLLDRLGPWGWDHADTVLRWDVMESIRELEVLLATWRMTRPDASEEHVAVFVGAAIEQMGVKDRKGE